MSNTIISEYKMKTQKESNSDGHIEDVLITRILILTLAAIKAGKVAEEKTDRNHATGSADDRPTMIAMLKITRITLTGIIIARDSDHIREDLPLLVTALELQAALPLEPPGLRHGTVLVVSALVKISLLRILIRSL